MVDASAATNPSPAAPPLGAAPADETRGRVLAMRGVELTLSAASGPVHILKGVDFQAEAGRSVAVVGPSGSGKSSLLAVAAGLERATDGEISLLGEDVRALGEDKLARLRRGRVGFVFQSFHLLPTLTALDNVRAPLEIAGVEDSAERARAALASVGLTDRLRHFPSQLSGGERQRVAVARALAPDPEIVFADEPTGNLDTETGSAVVDLLFALAADRSAALVLVSHDRDIASRADRQVAMRDGRIVT